MSSEFFGSLHYKEVVWAAKSVLSLLCDSAEDAAEKRSNVFDDGRLLPTAEPLRAFPLQRPETLSALPQGE